MIYIFRISITLGPLTLWVGELNTGCPLICSLGLRELETDTKTRPSCLKIHHTSPIDRRQCEYSEWQNHSEGQENATLSYNSVQGLKRTKSVKESVLLMLEYLGKISHEKYQH